MATYGLTQPARVDWWAEVKAAMNDALKDKGVWKTLIICGAFVALALLGIMGWLLYTQRDATTMLSLVSLLMNGLLYKRLSDVDGRVRGVERNTNGHTERLLGAALKDKEKG